MERSSANTENDRPNMKTKAMTAIAAASDTGRPLKVSTKTPWGRIRRAIWFLAIACSTVKRKILMPPAVEPVQPPMHIRKNRAVTGNVPQSA